MDRVLTAMKRIFFIGAGIALIWGSANSQISPGALSKPHRSLDGPKYCNQCHTPKKGVDRQKCLKCHTLLNERIQEGKGLHARAEYKACERCHVEHQGRNVDLVWWGKKGIKGFDHRLTGYVLKGAHQKVSDCRKCHNPANIKNPDVLKRAKKDLSRTYLGLSTDCTSCHKDPHQGQFKQVSCENCHTQNKWKPASRFDHSKTRFKLTGKHTSVRCSRCHPVRNGVIRFAGIPFRKCSDCHNDPHRTRFGLKCTQCHTTKDWHKLVQPFDHSQTDFPLMGTHQRVSCEKCHTPGRPKSEAPTTCSGCHRDPHANQFTGISCDQCHSVDTFQIPMFTVEKHDSTGFPLKGAHRAIPCSRCHRAVQPDQFALLTGLPSPDTSVIVFKFQKKECETCHTDPHSGEFRDKFPQCTVCHTVESWKVQNFNHNQQTDFQLKGAHSKLVCSSCHTVLKTTPRPHPLRFDDLPKTCAGCHGGKS